MAAGAKKTAHSTKKTGKQPGRKRKVGIASREHILKVCTELFAKEGFDRVTMRDVSKAVGLTMPSIYHHFKDKENLYREVEQANYGRLRARLMDALDEDEGAETRLRDFVGALYDILNEDPIFMSMAVRNMLDPDPKHHKYLVGVALQQVYDKFSALLNEVRKGSGDGMSPMIIMSGIVGFVLMNAPKRHIKDYKHRLKSQKKVERDEFIEYAVGAVLRV